MKRVIITFYQAHINQVTKNWLFQSKRILSAFIMKQFKLVIKAEQY